MYTEKSCLKCGGITRKEDVCSNCRQRATHQPREFQETRGQVNAKADILLSTPKEEAKRRYDEACYTIKILGGDAPESVWQEKKQMYALLNREVIKEETLT